MFSPFKYFHQLESSSLWLKTSEERDLVGLTRLWLPLWSDHHNQLKPQDRKNEGSQMCKYDDPGPLISGHGGCHFRKPGYCMSWSLGGMGRIWFWSLGNLSPPRKTKTHVYSKSTYSFFFYGQHINFWFHIMSRFLEKHVQQWFVPVSYLFYFIWQQNEDCVSNKSPVLSLIRFIEHYMLFLSSFSSHAQACFVDSFCGNILVGGFEEDKSHLSTHYLC